MSVTVRTSWETGPFCVLCTGRPEISVSEGVRVSESTHVKLAGKRAASRSPEDQPAAVTSAGAALAARQPRATRLTPATTSVPVTVVPVTSAPPPSAAPMETVPTVEESEESDDEASYDGFDGEMRIDASNGQPYTFDDFVDF